MRCAARIIEGGDQLLEGAVRTEAQGARLFAPLPLLDTGILHGRRQIVEVLHCVVPRWIALDVKAASIDQIGLKSRGPHRVSSAAASDFDPARKD